MYFFPAIDLKDRQCVRLYKGDMNKATVFNTDAGVQARQFAAEGAEWLHVVDLNGAIDGAPVNNAPVRAILDNVSIPVQLGGGIRTAQDAAYWLEAGIARVIIGTRALQDFDFVVQLCKAWPGRIALGIDALGGMVATHGWTQVSDTPATVLAERFDRAVGTGGIAAIIYTDIDRDGAMQGPNVAATRTLAQAVSIPVIASGGVSKIEDLYALRDAIPQLCGVIAGRALYDDALSVNAAVSALKEGGASC